MVEGQRLGKGRATESRKPEVFLSGVYALCAWSATHARTHARIAYVRTVTVDDVACARKKDAHDYARASERTRGSLKLASQRGDAWH